MPRLASPSPRRPALRILLGVGQLLALLLAWRLLIWLAANIYDERALERLLADWAHGLTRTDVASRSLGVGSNIRGRIQVKLYDVAIDPPNPLFERDLATIDAIRFSCPLWGLWGAPCEPGLELSRPRIRLERGGEGEGWNFAGLGFAPGEIRRAPFPVPHLGARTIAVRLREGALTLAADGLEIEGRLASREMTLDLRKGKLAGGLKRAEFVERRADGLPPAPPVPLTLRRFTFRPGNRARPVDVREAELLGGPVPLRWLRLLDPTLPEFADAALEGTLFVDPVSAAFDGSIRNAPLEGFGLGRDASLSVRLVRRPEAGEPAWEADLGAEGTVLRARPTAEGEPRLEIAGPRLDLDRLLADDGAARRLHAPVIRLEAKRLRCAGVDWPAAAALLRVGPETTALDLRCAPAGGGAELFAERWPLKPGAELRLDARFDAATAFRLAGERLPAALAAGPSGGQAILHLRLGSGHDLLRLSLPGLRLPIEGSGELWRALAALPAGAAKVRESLSFAELRLEWAGAREGGRLRIEGESDEFGPFSGEGALGEGGFQGEFRFSALPGGSSPARVSLRLSGGEARFESVSQAPEGRR